MMDFDIWTGITRGDESIGAEGGVRRIRVVDQKVDIARCSQKRSGYRAASSGPFKMIMRAVPDGGDPCKQARNGKGEGCRDGLVGRERCRNGSPR